MKLFLHIIYTEPFSSLLSPFFSIHPRTRSNILFAIRLSSFVFVTLNFFRRFPFRLISFSPFNFISNFLNFFLRSYIFLFRPILILQGYFGAKNSISIFFKSFGRIFFLPSNKFFYKKKYFFKINEKSRNKIKVLESDFLDKIFNLLIGKLCPVTFSEGFDFIKKQDYEDIWNYI